MINNNGKDPSSNAGNRRVMAGVPALAAAAALMLAACSSAPSSGPEKGNGARRSRGTFPSAVPQTTPQTYSPEQNNARQNEIVNQHAQAAAEDFASRILDDYRHKRGDVRTSDLGSHLVEVQYNAGTKIPGAQGGEYRLKAGFGSAPNSSGEFHIPDVNSINISELSIGADQSSAVVLHDLVMQKDETGNWQFQEDRNVSGIMQSIKSNTGDITTPGVNVAQFDAINLRIRAEIASAQNQTSTDYPPTA